MKDKDTKILEEAYDQVKEARGPGWTKLNLTGDPYDRNSDWDKVSGTSFKGYLNVSYTDLERVLGEPARPVGVKSTVEWGIIFYDGTVITIYDYKGHPSYKNSPLTQPQEWHIGAKSLKGVNKLARLFGRDKIDVSKI